jgi:hypothetical protein
MDINFLLIIGGLCLLISVFEGWIMVLIKYLKLSRIKKFFPGYQNLAKSHIDSVMMAFLLFIIYLVINNLSIKLSSITILALAAGALFGPLGFLSQAIKPELSATDTSLQKIGIMVGFIPATYGISAVVVQILCKLICT